MAQIFSRKRRWSNGVKSIVKVGKDSAFDRLTKKKKIAVIRLFEGATLKSISQEIDCHINTIENWKNNEEFQQARIDYSIPGTPTHKLILNMAGCLVSTTI